MEITEDQQNDQTIAQKDRPSEIVVEDEGDSTTTEEDPGDTTTDENTEVEEEEEYEVLDDTPLINAEKINWDGVKVVEGEIQWNKVVEEKIQWNEKKIGNTNLTQGQAAAGIGVGALVAIIIGSLVFAFITWRKRKAIAV